MDFFKHESAVIDFGATVGKGTNIWHFCHVMPKAIIGKNCILGQNVFVANHVVIGNHVKIQNNVSVYEGVTLEDEVFVGPSVVFTNVINPRSMVERKSEFKKTIVEKGASIGANATIICGNNIGPYAMIGAGTVVTKEVDSHAIVIGNPGIQIGWISEAGAKLTFENNKATCTINGDNYILENKKVTKLL